MVESCKFEFAGGAINSEVGFLNNLEQALLEGSVGGGGYVFVEGLLAFGL